MKKTILYLIFLIFFSATSYAQSTLQFSQVLLLVNGNSYTVPANRVWKITGMTATTSASTSLVLGATINTVASFFAAIQTNSQVTLVSANDNIIWLPAGTTISPANNTRLISVLEFITSP